MPATLQQLYQAWRASVLANGAPQVGDGQCVSLIVNNSRAYVEYLFPGHSWTTLIAPVVGAKDLPGAFNPLYFEWVANDHNNPNQLPPQGAIMVFDATPQAGYSNTYPNPYGHDGVNDGADSNGMNLLQQNAPGFGQGPNVTHYGWKVRPCLGWAIPRIGSNGSPTPVPPTSGKQLEINPGNWAVYTDDGKASAKLPGAVQGGQKYGPVQIASNGWGIITFTGKTGHIEPASFHLF